MSASGPLHIVLSISAAGSLRQALRAVGRRDPVVGFCDTLAYGPIDPPRPSLRWRWMTEALGYEREDWDWLPSSSHRFWRRASASASRRIVWTSSRCAHELAAFLALVERMEGQPLEVVDVADAPLALRDEDGQRWRDQSIGLGMLAPRIIAAEALWDEARPLSASERQVHLDAWRRLRAENAPIRTLGPDGLSSAPISHFDASLMSHASEQWRPYSRLVGETMGQDAGYQQAGDVFLLTSRIAHLIEAGELQCRMAGDGSDIARVRLALSEFPPQIEVRLPER